MLGAMKSTKFSLAILLFTVVCFGQEKGLDWQRLKPVKPTMKEHPRIPPMFAGPTGFVAPVAILGVGPDGAFHYVKLDQLGNVSVMGGGGSLLGGPRGHVTPIAPVALDANGAWQYLNIDAAGNLRTTGLARQLAVSNVVGSPPSRATSNCTPGTNPFFWVLDNQGTYQSTGCVDDVNWLGFPSSKGHLNISRAIIFNPSGITDPTAAHGNWWNGVDSLTQASNAGYKIQTQIVNPVDATVYAGPMFQWYAETLLKGTAQVGLQAGVIGPGFIRSRVDDFRTGGPAQAGFIGFNSVVTKQNAYSNANCTLASRQSCYAAFLSEVQQRGGDAVDNTNETYAGYDSTGVYESAVGGTSYGFHAWKPAGGLATNAGFGIEDFGSAAENYNLLSKGTATTGKNRFQGPVILDSHLNQQAMGGFAGTCTMLSDTSCTFSILAAYAETPGCIVTVQSSTPIAGGCTVSGTTVTITAALANSSTWAAMLFGNPN